MTVQPGQVWADNDPRVPGRTLRVDAVEGEHAICTVLTNEPAYEGHMPKKTTRIKLSRFKPTSTGYRFIENSGETE